MAEAQTSAAPLKKESAPVKTREQIALEQQFDTNKNYVFELAEQNMVRELPVIEVSNAGRVNRQSPHKKYRPWQNIVLTSQVVWNGQRRNLRYYDGCTSIFQDEQPKEKELIDQLIKQTRQRAFLEGKIIITGDERQLLLYMYICSWNGESEFRTRTANVIFVPVDKSKNATKVATRIDLMMEALKLSKEATDEKMLIHANFLGIPEMDYDSGNAIEIAETRTMYREKASENPAVFIESYGNKAIEIKYYINKALLDGTISNKFNPNKATWGTSNTEICDISGLRSHEAIAEKLLEFSQLEAGFEFSTQIRNLYK